MAAKLTLTDLRTKTGFDLSGEWHERELNLLDEVVTRFREVASFNPWPYPVTIELAKTGH